MTLGGDDQNSQARTPVSSELVTSAVTIAAIAMFAGIGSSVLPSTLDSLIAAGTGADARLVTALLLNVALIIFGWGRCKDLREVRAAREAAEGEARRAAYSDFATGLPNRRSFVQTAQRTRSDEPGSTTLLVIDLDHFKKVNDLFGHPVGDDLLRAVGSIIGECAPESACIARLGGDEFSVLLVGDAARRDNACDVADRILVRLAMPIQLRQTQAHIGASIGIATNDAQCTCVEALLTRSDIAMYAAKELGRNCYAWFDIEMERELRRRNEVESEMRIGLGKGEFIPFFQPQINLASGDLQGFEVLARWEHPTRGIVEPLEFIAIAEATGLIAELSLSVMTQALIEARNWNPALIIAVNISPVQLKDPILAQRISKVLVETGFPAKRLELEITESSFLENLDLALFTIESMKNLGVTISLDDFGTGYSSLTQLQALPFDRLKVDQSFVSSMIDSEESAAIVTAIVNLGASLSLPVTAEGVETEAIQKSLKLLGCSEAQGWLFGKAAPIHEIRAMLAGLEIDGAPLGLTRLPAGPQVGKPSLKERRDHLRRGAPKRSSGRS